MRMRFKPYARPELAAWPQFIDEPAQQRGRWKDLFANPALPLYLELGCGKGGFIARQALENPQRNHIGIDLKSEVLVVAKRSIEAVFAEAGRKADNVLILSQDIERVSDVLAPEDAIMGIFINFCNPWSKSGHAKHRLTHPRQLIQYRDFLAEGGEIRFKTDDEGLFEDSLRYFSLTGFELLWKTHDLHAENLPDNIATEHENMFSAKGIPIKACIARKQPAQLDRAQIFRLRNI